MQVAFHSTLGLALCCLGEMALAMNIQRCESPSGHTTFTSLGCPTGHTLMSEHHVLREPSYTNAPPMLLPPAEHFTARESYEADDPLVVIGEQDDGCGNRLSRSERRQAIIQQQTRPGMTLADIESALGRPDTITERNGEKQYVYKKRNGTTRVNFDIAECVKGRF